MNRDLNIIAFIGSRTAASLCRDSEASQEKDKEINPEVNSGRRRLRRAVPELPCRRNRPTELYPQTLPHCLERPKMFSKKTLTTIKPCLYNISSSISLLFSPYLYQQETGSEDSAMNKAHSIQTLTASVIIVAARDAPKAPW